jgi:CRP-like cAMP-binding protein
LVPVDILQIPSSVVLELLETDVAFASRLAKIAAWRVQRTSEMLMLMRMGNPALRSVIGISQFAETLAYNADRPPTIGFGTDVTIPINQTVLASLCGVSRSRLSSIIHALEKHGWLRLEYGRIEVLNLPAWHAFASLRRSSSEIKFDPSIEDLIECLHQSAPH